MTPPKETRRAEGRGRPEGNLRGEAKVRTQGRGALPPNLMRVNEAARRDRRTFSFLGFTHYCAWSRDGRFVVKRTTEGKRVTRKLHEVQTEMWRRMHAPVRAQHGWLSSVLRGHYAYYGLPSNWPRLDSFHQAVTRRWYRVLRRRSQRGLTWERFNALLARFPLPPARITHSREVSLASIG